MLIPCDNVFVIISKNNLFLFNATIKVLGFKHTNNKYINYIIY
jgi:hypothetical protein